MTNCFLGPDASAFAPFVLVLVVVLVLDYPRKTPSPIEKTPEKTALLFPFWNFIK